MRGLRPSFFCKNAAKGYAKRIIFGILLISLGNLERDLMYLRMTFIILSLLLYGQIGIVGAAIVEPISLPTQEPASNHALVSTTAPKANDVAINTNVPAATPSDNVPAATPSDNVATADQIAIAQTLKKEKKSL